MLSPLDKRVAIALIFAIHGATVGSLFSRIAELRLALAMNEAELGFALVGIPAGVLTGSLLVSRVIEYQGTRRTLLLALPFFALGPVLASLAVGTATLFAALFLFGLGLTTCNITMNVEADRVEAATGRRLINRCHGTWGLGFLLASLVGTGAVAAGIAPQVHFVVMFVLLTASTVAIAGPMVESPPRAHIGGPPKRLALPTLGVLLVMGFACSGIVLEGSTRNWSVIYLRDDFTAAAWVATLALPAIVIAQTAGRFMADPLIDKYGPVRVAMALTAVSFAGLSLVVAAWSVTAALIGFALIGLGISTTHPQALSAVARIGDRPSSQNVASFSTLQTALGFLAPPIFGLIAARYGIRVSFAVFLPMPLVALAFARFLEPQPVAKPA